tara:strand:- start:216 stop:419 length:204 start_codon:yes stop_codon:yes gene_type:complete
MGDEMRTIKDILDNARKGTNAAYQGVVKGKRPSRKMRATQRELSQYSRQDIKEYWTKKLEQHNKKHD